MKQRHSLVSPPSLSIEIPRSNPFDSSDWKFWTSRFWKCLWKPCDPLQWEKPVQEMLGHYRQFLRYDKDGSMYLKKGTKLYHGSIHYPFLPGSKESKNKMTYFGLDAVISLWYILEETLTRYDDQCFQQSTKQVEIEGYLYEFILQKDLQITKIIPTLLQNPKYDKECRRNPHAVCLHPQISFHGGDGITSRSPPNLFDLCNEVTLRYSIYESVIGEPVNVYHVNAFDLYQHRLDLKYHPFQSITHRVTKRQKIRKLTCEQYHKKM